MMADTDTAAHAAHDAYINAINSNDLDKYLGTITDDIVYLPPNSAAIVGKSEVGPWVQGYFDAFHTQWAKTTIEFVVQGDWPTSGTPTRLLTPLGTAAT